MIRAAVVALLSLASVPAFAASTGEEIRAAIGGNTVQGSMQASGKYTEFYAADGTIHGADYKGAWTIDGDAMCFQYGTDPKACWQVAIEGDQVSWLKDGAVDGSGTIVPGNPNNW